MTVNTSRGVTQGQLKDTWKGKNNKAVQQYKKLPLYASGKSLSHPTIERIYNHLVTEGVVSAYSVPCSSGYSNTYIQVIGFFRTSPVDTDMVISSVVPLRIIWTEANNWCYPGKKRMQIPNCPQRRQTQSLPVCRARRARNRILSRYPIILICTRTSRTQTIRPNRKRSKTRLTIPTCPSRRRQGSRRLVPRGQPVQRTVRRFCKSRRRQGFRSPVHRGQLVRRTVWRLWKSRRHQGFRRLVRRGRLVRRTVRRLCKTHRPRSLKMTPLRGCSG